MNIQSKWIELLQSHSLWTSSNDSCKSWPIQILLPTASSNYWYKWFGAPDQVDDNFLMYKTRKDIMYFQWADVKGIKFLNND